MIRFGRAWTCITLIALLLQNVSGLSQHQPELDRLLQELKTLKEDDDSTRFEVLKGIAFNHPDPVQSLGYARDALNLAKTLNDPFRIARALEEVCLSQRILGNKIESFEAAFEALRIYDSLEMREHQATMYIQIGGNYTLEKEYGRAIDFLSKGKQVYESLQDKAEIIIAEINIGETYRLMDRMDSAEWYLLKALKGCDELKNGRMRGYALGNLGMVYARQSKHEKAQPALQEAIRILTGLGDVYSESVYISELGMVLIKTGNSKKGEKLLQDALNLAEENKLKEQIRDISFALYKMHEENKEFEKALYFHQLSKNYQDSLNNLENVKAVEQMKGKYEVEKRDKEIAVQRTVSEKNLYQRNIILIVSVFLLVIVIVSILAYIRKQKDNKLLALQRNELAKREEQKNWLLGELQHRTKNNLQMISSLLSLQSRQLVGHPSYEALREGQSRVDALAVIHQRLYQEGSQLKINLHDYLIELTEKLVYGFNKDVVVKSEIDDFEIDVDKAVPLALIVNELVTNALKHAYSETVRAQLLIRFKKYYGESVVLDIVDNGKGMTENQEEGSNAFGFRLIRSLASQLKATVQQLKVEHGCHWRIELPENVIC